MSDKKPTPADWQALAAKEVKGRDLTWATPEGIAVKPLYTADGITVSLLVQGTADEAVPQADATASLNSTRTGGSYCRPSCGRS